MENFRKTLKLKKRTLNGFTTTELVIIIVITLILSKAATSQFFVVSTYNQQVYKNEVMSTIRYARKLAIATNSYVQVAVSPISAGNSTYTTITLRYATFSGACGSTVTLANIVDPLTNNNSVAYARTAPDSVTFTVTGTFPIYFNSLGQALTVSGGVCTSGTNSTITVSGESAITIYGETGFLQ